MNKINLLKNDIAEFMCRLYRQGLTTTSGGNISARCGDYILITPSASDKGNMRGEEIGVLDLEGRIIGSAFRPTIESNMHLEIYRARPDVEAVVHAHPASASAFAASSAEINTAYLAESHVVLGKIAYAEYRCQGTVELAEIVAISLSDSDCVIMRNHGALTVGSNLLQAFDRLEVLESTARINLLLSGALKPYAVEIPADELDKLNRFRPQK